MEREKSDKSVQFSEIRLPEASHAPRRWTRRAPRGILRKPIVVREGQQQITIQPTNHPTIPRKRRGATVRKTFTLRHADTAALGRDVDRELQGFTREKLLELLGDRVNPTTSAPLPVLQSIYRNLRQSGFLPKP